jgi:2-(1,2-epoxy-1,2-dihydrophenyl)acetyl-CoA isomerase
MIMQYENLIFDVNNGVGWITLHRPEAKNAINVEFAKDLMNIVLQCSEDKEVRAVLITSSGNIFCPGGDLKAFEAEGDEMPYYLKEITTYWHSAVSLLVRSEAPVVIAVNGMAAGVGMSLACSGDIVIAAESARFTVAYTRMGLTPDGGASYFLSRIVGFKRALELALTNRELSSAEALDLGIVTQVVPDEALLDRAGKLAEEFASGPTVAYGATKRLFHMGWTDTLESQLKLESETIANMCRTKDAREAINAFVEKRKPAFQGR